MNNVISHKAKSIKNAKNIEIIFTENDLSISKKMTNCSCSDLLLATHEIVSKLFDKQTVAKAIEKLNTESKSKSIKNANNIQIVFNENDLSISKTLTNCSCVDVISTINEIVSKLFDKQTVAKAIEKLNTDSKSKSDKKAKSKSSSSKATSSESTSTQTETKLAA